MRRLRSDDGAVAIIVALLTATVFLAVGALVVDAGQLYAEKRELQNGADAGALAIAYQCAKSGLATCTATKDATAAGYANANATDGKAAVDSVTFPTSHSVTVATSTLNGDGSTLLPPFLARAVMGDAYQGTVHTSATALWGPVGVAGSSIPLTISSCEWGGYTHDGQVYVDPSALPKPPSLPPAGSPAWPATPEAHLSFHGDASPCTVDGQGVPSPSGSDLPGGFGWLDTGDGCQTQTGVDGWFDDSTGVAVPGPCDPSDFTALVGHVVYVPVFGAVNGLTGSNGKYEIVGYAAFYLTGYQLGGQYKQPSVATGWTCKGTDRCVSGWFTTGTYSGLPSGDGVDMGVTAVRLTG